MAEVNDFEEDLPEAQKWERRLKEVANRIVVEESELIDYETDAAAQRSGVDIAIRQRTFDGVQAKVRDSAYCCDDIFFETISVVEEDEPGWVYTYDDILVIYCWENKPGSNLQDGVLLLVNDAFRTWFDGQKHRYQLKQTRNPSYRQGKTWHTEGRIVPIGDIPRGFIRHANRKPSWLPLPTDVVTDQQTLGGASE